MPGSTDLDHMLATLAVTQRPGEFTVVTLDPAQDPVPSVGNGVEAVVVEAEGTTVVVTAARATDEGWPVQFRAAWLTLDVHSALDAVGLTAAVSAALADESIPCNVIAAYHHDHLLVPAERVDDALLALGTLRPI